MAYVFDVRLVGARVVVGPPIKVVVVVVGAKVVVGAPTTRL